MSPKRKQSNERSDSDANERRVQKPVLEVGQEVMSVWWDYDDDGNANNTWWPGVVTNVTVDKEKDFGYGLIRHYDIGFDDGDQLSSVPECYVFSREEYYLAIKSLTKKWDAIENIRDEESEDEWAKKVGWYNLSVDGETTESFPLLCDALEAYKAYKRGVKRPKFSTDEDDSSSVDSSFSFVNKSNHNFVCSHCNKAFKSKSGFHYHLGEHRVRGCHKMLSFTVDMNITQFLLMQITRCVNLSKLKQSYRIGHAGFVPKMPTTLK
jgi:hypothetical protein